MITGAVGICGSGKTYGMQRIVAAELRKPTSPWRLVILDVNSEWPGEPARGTPPLRFAGARTAGEVARALAAGERAVLVRPGLGAVGDFDADRAFADSLAQIAIACRLPVCLVIPEVHRYLPEGKPAPPHLRTVIHQYRHTRTGLVWDTQQFADVRKELLRETVHGLYLYGQAHHTSLKRVQEEFGPRTRALLMEAARRKKPRAKGGDDQPGWHVLWHPGDDDASAVLVRN